jgi:hypothetical protein
MNDRLVIRTPCRLDTVPFITVPTKAIRPSRTWLGVILARVTLLPHSLFNLCRNRDRIRLERWIAKINIIPNSDLLISQLIYNTTIRRSCFVDYDVSVSTF